MLLNVNVKFKFLKETKVSGSTCYRQDANWKKKEVTDTKGNVEYFIEIKQKINQQTCRILSLIVCC